MIDRLLRSPRRAELREIGDVRRANPLDDERRPNWDAVQVLVDFEAARARLNERVEPDLLWHIRARGGDQQFAQRAAINMRSAQIVWIVAAFRKLWPAQSLGSSVTWGDKNPWDASEYLWSLVSRLGDDTSDEAIAAIEALRDMPQDGYTDHIRAVAAEQRQKRVEKTYLPPTLQQIMIGSRRRPSG